MTDIRLIDCKRAKAVNLELAELLEDYEARVESGEVESMVLGFVTSDGEIGWDHSSGPDAGRMWQAICHAEKQFYKQVICDDYGDE